MDEPTNSQFVHEISQHPAQTVAASILAYPDVKVIHPADPSWYEWEAQWSQSGRVIDLTMTLFDDETWGGSGVEADCLAGDIIDIWSHLQTIYSGVWLHAPDCTMHTQASFLKGLIVAEAEQAWANLVSPERSRNDDRTA